jgi:hypothetical protein
MAWAVLRYLEADDPGVDIGWLVASERLRARRYAARLRDDVDPAPLMRAWLNKRAHRRGFRAAGDDLADLAADRRVRQSGLALPLSGMVAVDVLEGYVDPGDVQHLVDDYFLIPDSGVDANVVLHVAKPLVDPASWPVVAADLAEHNRAREDGRVEALVRGSR